MLLSVSDILLEDGGGAAAADPEVQDKKIQLRAFYARVVINLCVSYIGAYLSLAQLAKNYKVYSEKTVKEPVKNFLDKLVVMEPWTMIKFIIFVYWILWYYEGEDLPWCIISDR